MTEKILVIGSGFLGNHIIKEAENLGFSTIGTKLNSNSKKFLNLDIRNIDSVFQCISQNKPDLVINCAANTKIDYLENNPIEAFSINSDGAKNVAIIANKAKIKLIHVSTDSIFDGKNGMYTEEDIPNPINVYAKSKVLAEKYIMENSDDYILIRTNFYGYDKNDRFLLNWILKNLKENKQFTGFDDVIFTPLEVSNLSQLILNSYEKGFCGIINLSSDNPISKYQFVIQVAKTFGFDERIIKKGSIDEANFLAKRPKNTSLSNNKAKQLLDIPIQPLKSTLEELKKA